MLRVLVRLEAVALWITLLIISTFIHFRMPYFSFTPPHLSDMTPWLSLDWFHAGTFNSNLQLIVIMACILLSRPAQATLILFTYLAIGLSGVPIFYQGGGLSYFAQPTTGYLLSLLPAVWLLALRLRRHRRIRPQFKPYLVGALLSLLLIHLAGGIYAALTLEQIPIQFLAGYSLPQMPAHLVLTLLLAILVFDLDTRMYRVHLASRSTRQPR